jgi:hypothetical protein
MYFLKRFVYFLIILSLFSYSYAFPPSIARYAVIGETREGNVAAFMITHFGSSHAPFANLVIKKAGRSDPLFQDGAYKMDGGEKELAELADYLLEKNADVLKNYNIDLSNQHISEAHMVVSDNNQPELTAGWVDIGKRGIKEFAIKSIPSVECPSNSNAIDLEYWFNGNNQMTVKQKSDSCWENGFSIRNIYKTQKALWFVVNKHANGLEEQDVYFIDIQGIILY